MKQKRGVIYGAGVAVLVAMVAAWYFLLWSPQGHKLATLHSQQATYTSQATTLAAQLAQLRTEAKHMSSAKAQLSKQGQAVPSTPNIAQLILQVDSAAHASDFQFLGISPGIITAPTASGSTAAPKGSPNVIPISVKGSGTFFQVLDFMHRISGLPRVVVFNNIALSGSSSSGVGVSPTLNVTLSGNVFTTAPAPSATGGAG